MRAVFSSIKRILARSWKPSVATILVMAGLLIVGRQLDFSQHSAAVADGGSRPTNRLIINHGWFQKDLLLEIARPTPDMVEFWFTLRDSDRFPRQVSNPMSGDFSSRLGGVLTLAETQHLFRVQRHLPLRLAGQGATWHGDSFWMVYLVFEID